MFNEAFWFFYLIGVVGHVSVLFFICMILSGLGIPACVIWWADSYGADEKKMLLGVSRNLLQHWLS